VIYRGEAGDREGSDPSGWRCISLQLSIFGVDDRKTTSSFSTILNILYHSRFSPPRLLILCLQPLTPF
jgi:hypothetical protein